MPEDLSLNTALAIMGDEDIVLGFQALGFKVYAVSNPQDFKSAIDKVAEEKIAICLVQDNIYNTAIEQINNYRYLTLPVFVPFSQSARTDLLDRLIRDIRLKATGAF
jgi:vacuolar-type H+-ATPase subunit F/Vma7